MPTLRTSLQSAIEALPSASCRRHFLHTITSYERSNGQLAGAQRPDGSWQFDRANEPLTVRMCATAWALRALAKPHRSGTSPSYDSLNRTIFEQVRSELQAHDRIIATQGDTMLTRLDRANRRYEITLLPRYFGETLRAPAIPAQLYIRLGSANLYSWLAYTIYDHILDEAEDISLLPLANIAHRRSLHHYRSACLNEHISTYVEQVFDKMDAANAWEKLYARAQRTDTHLVITALPDYHDRSLLAERAFVHALGPIIVAATHGTFTAEQRQALHQSLSHYLIARQLNDDAHDWQDDIQAGQLTYVVTRLLAATNHQPGSHALEDIITTLQQHFWESLGDEICHTINAHISEGLDLLATCTPAPANTRLTDLYRSIARSAARSRSLKQRGEHFAAALKF